MTAAGTTLHEHPWRVLVIDDEPMIGRIVRRTLGPEYNVVAVLRATDALVLLEAGEHFDAVLCDLMMPSMSGIELYCRIETLRPELLGSFAFLTGGPCNADMREFLAHAERACLEKPFHLDALRELVVSLRPPGSAITAIQR